MSGATDEIRRGERFAFGENWARFLRTLDAERIGEAERALRGMLECQRLDGLRFLDAGCGSGLSSLAARRLGATVHSFDYDPQAVACTREIKRRYRPGDTDWIVEQGSVLDRAYLARLGRFDIVYSWGVLHHTGALWQALENAAEMVGDGGRLFIAIYNDQGHRSRRWAWIKRSYNRHRWMRPFLLAYGLGRTWGLTMLLDLCQLRPFASWHRHGRARGMSPWTDLVDWVGGWPYEVATPEAVFRFCRARGFLLENLVTRQGIGCNEFVFRRG